MWLQTSSPVLAMTQLLSVCQMTKLTHVWTECNGEWIYELYMLGLTWCESSEMLKDCEQANYGLSVEIYKGIISVGYTYQHKWPVLRPHIYYTMFYYLYNTSRDRSLNFLLVSEEMTKNLYSSLLTVHLCSWV